MVILSVAWDVYIEGINKSIINPNGCAIAVRQICEYIGRRETSYLLIGSWPMEGIKLDNINVIETAEELPNERNTGNVDKWQKLLKGIFEHTVKELKPDFIFLHAPGEFTYKCAKYCQEINYPYAVICHGLGSSDGKVFIPTEWENRMLSIKGQKIITVSKRTKERILEFNDSIQDSDITVIPNGTEFHYIENDIINCGVLMRKKFHLDGRKILLCVGTIHPNKNQKMLVRAFALLPDEIKQNLCVVFCGKDSIKVPSRSKLNDFIREMGLENQIIDAGVLNRAEMTGLYSIADGLAQPSIYEGMSLAVLEMLSFGAPVILFADNGGVFEVGDRDASVVVNERSDNALADAIIRWYEREWDKRKIKSFSRKFSMERVADDYIRFAKNISMANMSS